ncbi:MAG TPA: hypothetical protein VK835_00555 [Bacteroidia bacterium]|jgi:hypothetical protein|nr:hypothetical protein [Bacteroidia bacterium]
MKKLLSFLFIMTISVTYSQKQVSRDTSKCLTITGNFDGTVKDLEGTYKAKLMRDNKVIEEQNLSVKKSFEFTLRKNMLYAIKVEKEGYISKILSISTKMSDKIEVDSPYKFNFETNLISQELYGHFNDDDVDFPVALVSYGKKCDCYEYNREYTAKLINRMYTNLLFGSGTN